MKTQKNKKNRKNKTKKQKKNTESRIENRKSAYSQTIKFQLKQKNHRFGSNHHQRTIYPGFRFFGFHLVVSTSETREIIQIDIPTWLLHKQLASIRFTLPAATCYDTHAHTSYYSYSYYYYYYYYYYLF